jgi:SAM-dependent methyltransferase
MSTATIHDNCPICGSPDIDIFIEIDSVPVFCNVLSGSIEAALNTPKGTLRLGFCNRCGHIYNYAFSPNELDYGTDYENSLFYSESFRNYANDLARSLIDRYDLRNKNIVEIACGKGDFLLLLCELGNNKGLGFDPSFDPQRTDGVEDPRIRFVKDYYSEKYRHIQADFVCCRHALEHIPQPGLFLDSVKRSADGQKPVVFYFEVPNALFTLKDEGIWDLLYEHCSYFTPPSLRHAFESAGFRPLDLRTAFDNQFLCIEAEWNGNREPHPENTADSPEGIVQYVRNFEAAYRRKVSEWKDKIGRWQRDGVKVALWGAGTKGMVFSNILRLESVAPYMVDINPHKHCRYAPGTGQMVVSPDFLKSYRPDHVVVMNAVYREEIRETLGRLGLEPEIDVA